MGLGKPAQCSVLEQDSLAQGLLPSRQRTLRLLGAKLNFHFRCHGSMFSGSKCMGSLVEHSRRFGVSHDVVLSQSAARLIIWWAIGAVIGVSSRSAREMAESNRSHQTLERSLTVSSYGAGWQLRMIRFLAVSPGQGDFRQFGLLCIRFLSV